MRLVYITKDDQGYNYMIEYDKENHTLQDYEFLAVTIWEYCLEHYPKDCQSSMNPYKKLSGKKKADDIAEWLSNNGYEDYWSHAVAKLYNTKGIEVPGFELVNDEEVEGAIRC